MASAWIGKDMEGNRITLNNRVSGVREYELRAEAQCSFVKTDCLAQVEGREFRSDSGEERHVRQQLYLLDVNAAVVGLQVDGRTASADVEVDVPRTAFFAAHFREREVGVDAAVIGFGMHTG